MKTNIDQFLAKTESDSADGGHEHGQKNDICVMIDLAGRDADPGTFADMSFSFAAGGASDSA